jgi:glucose-6-phosphate 1-dehydrogenase
MKFSIVFLGGTGDLAWRKLMPAMFEAYRHGGFPQMGRVLASAREPMDTVSYHQWLWQKFESLSWGEPLQRSTFDEFCKHLEYRPLDLSAAKTYKQLGEWVHAEPSESVVFYLATAPSLFIRVCEGLAGAGLNKPHMRVVLEKPLGKDLDSAREINNAVSQHFSEKQIFRIDHYLGKQSVQNLMALRFGNTIFEPVWRRESISHVQITLAEDLGVEARGAYYEQAGALRDMVQNHLLQLLCIVAMEPPASDDADAIRDEKLKVLRCLRPIEPHEMNQLVVRGQYRAGVIGTQAVPAYVDEKNVAPDSRTETYVAIRAEIDNWRWAGVPFFLRTGKRMPQRGAEIVINFRPVPHPIFPMPLSQANNRLVIRLQPEDTIELHLLSKASNRSKAEQGRLVPVQLDLDFREAFGKQMIEGYERLLRKVIAGRLDLFVRFDEQEAAWKWVTPIQQAWVNDPMAPRPYAAGTWGPAAASALTARENFSWPEDQ